MTGYGVRFFTKLAYPNKPTSLGYLVKLASVNCYPEKESGEFGKMLFHFLLLPTTCFDLQKIDQSG
jgi:hypothetical protein